LPRARLRWWWMSHQTGVRQPLTMARHSRVRHYFGAVYARTKAASLEKLEALSVTAARLSRVAGLQRVLTQDENCPARSGFGCIRV